MLYLRSWIWHDYLLPLGSFLIFLSTDSFIYFWSLQFNNNSMPTSRGWNHASKMLKILASFCLFWSFSHDNLNINWKSVDVVLGAQTRGLRMVGTDRYTEPLIVAPMHLAICRIFRKQELRSKHSNQNMI